MALSAKNWKVIKIAGSIVAVYIGYVIIRNLVNAYQVGQIKQQQLSQAKV